VLLFLVLAGKIPPCFDYYVVTHSYSSRPFLCALGAVLWRKHTGQVCY